MSLESIGPTVTIVSWEEYQIRKDVKAPSWFRLDHSLFDNHEFYDFSHAELLSWIYLLTIASKKSSGTVTINFLHAERVGRLTRSEILSAIEKLQRIGVVLVAGTDTLRERNEDVHSASATRQDITRQDKTEQDTICTELERKRPKLGAIDKLRGNQKVEKALEGVKQSTQELWLESYPDIEWLKGEILKALIWIETNPRKAPKKFASFMSNWLSRGWEGYRKSLPTIVPLNRNVSVLPNSHRELTEAEKKDLEEHDRAYKEIMQELGFKP